MSPLAVLTGIVFGSAVTMTIGLAMVLAVFLILGGDYPRPALEMRRLVQSLGLFVLLASSSGGALWTVLYRNRRWWLAQAAMWACVLGLAFYYWPK